jgi:AcrR family transcriptional regulator
MEKDNIQNLLIHTGRQIVKEKGADALTARKLSEASSCSVGAIYNQFSNMDNFILVQNYLTLDELSEKLQAVEKTDDPFTDMNNFLQAFVDFVLANNNLWFMLYNYHLTSNRTFSFYYLRKVASLIRIVNQYIEKIIPNMDTPERLLSAQVLWLSLLSISSFLTNNSLDGFSKVSKTTLCRIFLNTYLAGLTVLEHKS